MDETTIDVDRDIIRRCWDNLTGHADDFALACSCPVAEAASKVLGRTVSVILVDTAAEAYQIVEGDWHGGALVPVLADVPEPAVEFIHEFDRAFYGERDDQTADGPKLPEPISFTIPAVAA